MTAWSEPTDDAVRDADRRLALAREWDQLVEQVRGLDGFADFLRPPTLDELLPAAAGGPIVVVNVSRWRCDALICTARGVHSVALPALTLHSVTDVVREYLQAQNAVDATLQALHEARRVALRPTAGATVIQRYSLAKRAAVHASAGRDEALRTTTAWLWDVIASPVLDALGFSCKGATAKDLPRLWWCPTGLLTLLPLHAAGYDDGSGRTMLDHAVTSYTPTVRALARARATQEPSTHDESHARLLMVSVPELAGQEKLPAAEREESLIARLLPDRHTLMRQGEATRAAVLDGLVGHSWVHFSCHGAQDLSNPSTGGILLADGLLSITDIGNAEYRGEFAFLAACKTAVGGTLLPDEAITLTAALHYAGYRHVVGTMWSVYDSAAAEVAERLYPQLTSGGVLDASRTAYALHAAVTALREGGWPLHSWTPFAHTGP